MKLSASEDLGDETPGKDAAIVEDRPGVNFNRRTQYWTAKTKVGRFVSFGVKHFGYNGAKKLAVFAANVFDSSKNQNLKREDVFTMYKEKYGSLPVNDGLIMNVTTNVIKMISIFKI